MDRAMEATGARAQSETGGWWRLAAGGWRLAAYGSSGLVEESAQDGDLEERVERHVVICARAGGQCGATRRDGGGSGSGCSSSCCVSAPRVSRCGAFAFLLAESGILQRLMLSHGTKAQTRRPSGPGARAIHRCARGYCALYSPPFPCLTVVGRERGAGTSSTQIVRARE